MAKYGAGRCGADSLFLKNIPLGFLRVQSGLGTMLQRSHMGLPWTEAMKSGELRALLLTKLGLCGGVSGYQEIAPGALWILQRSLSALGLTVFLKSSVKVASLKTNT